MLIGRALCHFAGARRQHGWGGDTDGLIDTSYRASLCTDWMAGEANPALSLAPPHPTTSTYQSVTIMMDATIWIFVDLGQHCQSATSVYQRPQPRPLFVWNMRTYICQNLAYIIVISKYYIIIYDVSIYGLVWHIVHLAKHSVFATILSLLLLV